MAFTREFCNGKYGRINNERLGRKWIRFEAHPLAINARACPESSRRDGPSAIIASETTVLKDSSRRRQRGLCRSVCRHPFSVAANWADIEFRGVVRLALGARQAISHGFWHRRL